MALSAEAQATLPKYDITPAELAMVQRVYRECLEEQPNLPGLITFSGAETAALFDKKWTHSLGEVWDGPRTSSGAPPIRYQRRVEILFVGSPRWPKGVPVGMTDIYGPSVVGETDMKRKDVRADLTNDQMLRLKTMSNGRRWRSPEEHADRRLKRETMRAGAMESQLDPGGTAAKAVAEVFAKAMGLVTKSEAAAEPEPEKATTVAKTSEDRQAMLARMEKARAARRSVASATAAVPVVEPDAP